MKWHLDQFHDKDVVFVGVGQGRAMAGIKPFIEKHGDISSFVGVDRPSDDASLDFLKQYDSTKTVFIKNEAIPGADMPIPYITPMQLFFSLVPQTRATTIGITGTKGKSTSTALTAHILRAAGKQAVLAGNIGNSPFDGLETATAETIFVLELSSHQLSDMTTSPHISACLNLYNDHSDWHGSMDKYWEAKHTIMRFADPDDLFVYNPTFSTLQEWSTRARCRTIAINPTEALDLSQAHLFGDHNRLNALVVRAITRECGVDDATFMRGLNSFVPLRHRMQIVATKRDRTYVDDAIGMTPESTMASLKAIQTKLGRIGCVLMGGYDRSYDFSGVMHLVADMKIPCLVFFPDTIQKMRAALPADYTPEIFETRNMTDAVRWADEHAPEHSVVALSTAAPSYSLWRDFEEKGDQFQAAVNTL